MDSTDVRVLVLIGLFGVPTVPTMGDTCYDAHENSLVCCLIRFSGGYIVVGSEIRIIFHDEVWKRKNETTFKQRLAVQYTIDLFYNNILLQDYLLGLDKIQNKIE